MLDNMLESETERFFLCAGCAKGLGGIGGGAGRGGIGGGLNEKTIMIMHQPSLLQPTRSEDPCFHLVVVKEEGKALEEEEEKYWALVFVDLQVC